MSRKGLSLSRQKGEKNEKKSLRERFHDYMMDLSRISPSGLTDHHDEYYFHINRYYNFD